MIDFNDDGSLKITPPLTEDELVAIDEESPYYLRISADEITGSSTVDGPQDVIKELQNIQTWLKERGHLLNGSLLYIAGSRYEKTAGVIHICKNGKISDSSRNFTPQERAEEALSRGR